MWAGKSQELIRLADRYRIAGKRVLMIKYVADTRYSVTDIATHSGVRVKADASVDHLSDLDIQGYDVVCVDEVQFYPDNTLLIQWADSGYIVVASGLSGNFLRHQFQGIPELIAAADKITQLTSVCMQCNSENGCFSAMRKDTNKTDAHAAEKELIGGKETYLSLCRQCYKEFALSS
jgi:thymidine kinase